MNGYPRDMIGYGAHPPHAAWPNGARLALLNRRHRRRAVALARRIEVIELSGRADFNDRFIQNTSLGAAPLAAAA